MRRCITKTWQMITLPAISYFDEPLVFGNFLLRLLRMVLLLSIWRILLAGKGSVSGMTLGSVLTYTLVSEVFAEPLACRTAIANAIWSGAIGSRFLRPMSVFAQFMIESASGWCMSFLTFSIPLFLISPLLGVNPLPASASCGAWFVLSLAMAVTVGMALEVFFASLVIVFGTGDYSVTKMREAITILLSGALLPLAMMPWGVGRAFEWLPFASMVSAPLRIYTGTGDPVHLIALQAVWAVVLWPAAIRSWNIQRERLVTYGG